jgi:hypothetical protein
MLEFTSFSKHCWIADQDGPLPQLCPVKLVFHQANFVWKWSSNVTLMELVKKVFRNFRLATATEPSRLQDFIPRFGVVGNLKFLLPESNSPVLRCLLKQNYLAGLWNCLVEVRGAKSSFASPLSREPPMRRTPEAFPVASEARVCTPDIRDGSPRACSTGFVSAPRWSLILTLLSRSPLETGLDPATIKRRKGN